MATLLGRRIFSGIQPTGIAPHIGNYLGAIKHWVHLQESSWEERRENEENVLFSVVDLHALTSRERTSSVREQTRDMTAALLACGLDPNRCVLYAQSDVAQHAELCWILSCFTPIGDLRRMTQYKDKSRAYKEKEANLGLFSYPVLQAADILLYRATHVPVGDDQRQHLELSRSVAQRFNQFVGREGCLVPPETLIAGRDTCRLGSLRDATKKMSKSDPSDMSRINLTDNADEIRNKIRKAKTDSEKGIEFDPERRPEVSNLVATYAAFQDMSIDRAIRDLTSSSQHNNMSGLKSAVTDVLIAHVCPIGDEIARLKEDQSYVDAVLERGATRARSIAEMTMRDVRNAMGLS